MGNRTIDKPQRLFYWICFCLTFVGFVILIFTKPISQDEGVFLTIGKFMREGNLPYRDFFDHKPPAIYFLFSLLPRDSITGIIIAKSILSLLYLVVSLLVFQISEYYQPSSGIGSALFFLALSSYFEGYFLIAEPFVAACLLLSLAFLISKNHRVSFFLAGFFALLSVLFKQTAVISLLPLCTFIHTNKPHQPRKRNAMSLFRCASPAPEARRSRSEGEARGRAGVGGDNANGICEYKHFENKNRSFHYFLAGIIVPSFLFLFYLVHHEIFWDAYQQIIVLNFTTYPKEHLISVVHSIAPIFLKTLPIWLLLIFSQFRILNVAWIITWLAFLPLPFLFFRHYPHYWIQIIPFVAIIAGSTLHEYTSSFMRYSTLIFCLFTTILQIINTVPYNLSQLRNQITVARQLQKIPAKLLLAENQFTAFNYLLNIQPLNRFLYITEINNGELAAEIKTIKDLERYSNLLVLWPHDPNYAYAKQLQDKIIRYHTPVYSNENLGLDAYLIDQ